MKKWILHAIFFIPVWVFAQTYAPQYKTPYTITNDSSSSLNNYQVLVLLNTQSLITSGRMKADGGDIRFTPVECSPTILYDYWIEDGLNTDSTRIWVKIPTISGSNTSQMLLWYGDPTASSLSNFANTFPNTYISAGNDTSFSGSIYYDWFQLDSGDVIMLQNESILEIKARVMYINGYINGNGKGYAAPFSMNDGNGPGGGGMSSTAGAGGGSYGGFGGAGGYDASDMPGDGGPTYGSDNDLSLLMGSSGGSTDNAMGGNGGGAIRLSAEWIEINGTIEANGRAGIGDIGRCGGGGSGGTILVSGENVYISSSSVFSANGGDGGDGTFISHDGGGGGAGGRIKIFYENQGTAIGSFSYNGGIGGDRGDVSEGIDGGAGSFTDTTNTVISVYATSSTELPLQATMLNLDSIYCLSKDSIHMFANPSGGTFAGPGVLGDYFFPLMAGAGIHEITYLYNDPYGCGNLYDTAIVEVLNIPTFHYVLNNSPLCTGNTVVLSSSDSLSTHSWTGPNGFTSTQQNPIIPYATSTDAGMYSVTITNASGCSSTLNTHVIVYPTPTVSVSNSSPICLEEDLSLAASGGALYTWTGPNGFASASQNPIIGSVQFPSEGIYTVTITDVNNCSTTATTFADIDGCYDNVEDHPENLIYIYPNPTTNYVWIDIKDLNYSGEVDFELLDLSGKKVFTSTANLNSDNRIHVDLSTYSDGTYLLIVSDGIFKRNFKIVKN